MPRKNYKRPYPEELQPLQQDENPLFVVYARKSTDESSEKQTASIPQQIENCKKYCEKESIFLAPRPQSVELDEKTIQEIEDDNRGNLSKARELIFFYTEHWIVTERKSAKEPFKRPEWRNIIKQSEKGKIRGVLAYSPDRMSRNLQEGGELIQLVDNKFIRLKFSTFHFEDNAAGHMMLGFWLVFAEHYSRKLSEDVQRGSTKKLELGKAQGVRKFGYTVNEDDFFVPDPFHFKILKRAFERKLHDNWSDNKIAKEMNDSGWHQELKNTAHDSKKMSPRKISNNQLWYDPFYYGVFSREFKSCGVIESDLRELDYTEWQFTPLITQEDWELLQEKLRNTSLREIRKRRSRRGKELDDIRPMPDGMLKLKGGHAFNFMLPNRKRFESKVAKLKQSLHKIVEPKQIRYRYQGTGSDIKTEFKWSEIDKLILAEFKNIKVSEEDYQAYLYIKIRDLKKKLADRKILVQSINLSIGNENSLWDKFLEATNGGIGLTGKKKEFWENKERLHETKIKKLESQKAEILEDTRDYIAEQRSFCELIKCLPELWKKATYAEKREILNILVLNIISTPEKELQINLKPELESLFIRSGGQERT